MLPLLTSFSKRIKSISIIYRQLETMVQKIGLFSVISSTLSFTSGIAMAGPSKSIDIGAGGTGVHAPVGRDGEGLYTASTKGCFDVIDTASPLILNEIEKQAERKLGSYAYHIADYGTADGGTSLGLMTKMVQKVRMRNGDDEKEVVLHYEDQLT